jgi:hypothetical protein
MKRFEGKLFQISCFQILAAAIAAGAAIPLAGAALTVTPSGGRVVTNLFRGDFTPYDPSEIAIIKEAIGKK